VSARLLATLCLAFGSVPVSSAQSAASADATVVVYLRTGGSQPAAPLAQMKREVNGLMGQAGYRVEWRSLDADRGAETDAPLLVVLELSGICGIGAGNSAGEHEATSSTSLATTMVTEGRVLPFSTLNCTALTRSISGSLAKDAGAQRDFLYGRAMGRVVAHELYHVLMRTTEHARWGVARSCFSTSDLLTERFEFEGVTLARLRHRLDTIDLGATGDEATDR
jgi:hypothetical protein